MGMDSAPAQLFTISASMTTSPRSPTPTYRTILHLREGAHWS